MFWCVTGFSIASLLCGTATTLEELIVYRILQWLLGAPITPLSQAIILGVFERRQHSVATAIWGVGVVCGPIIGPTIGGFVAEAGGAGSSSRRPLCRFHPQRSGLHHRPATECGHPARLDRFLALSLAVASFQLMLIMASASTGSITGNYHRSLHRRCQPLPPVHSATADKPFLDPKLFLDRNFTVGLFFAFAFEGLAFVPMVLLPTMLQDLQGYRIHHRHRTGITRRGQLGRWRSAGTTGGAPRSAHRSCHRFRQSGSQRPADDAIDLNLDAGRHGPAPSGFRQQFSMEPLTVIALERCRLPNSASNDRISLIRNLGSAIVISICVGVVIYSSGVGWRDLRVSQSIQRGVQLVFSHPRGGA